MDIALIRKLIDLLANLAQRNSVYSSVLHDCVSLIEWMKLYKLSDLKNSETDLLKYCSLYLQMWYKQTNAHSDQCLLTAHEMAVEFFQRNSDWNNTHDWIIYFKILLFLGHYQRAIEVISIILSKPSDNDIDYANYLFYAGVVHKAAQDYDKANNYFFESTQSGPPKFFTSIEMMTIISRNLEDMEGDEDADREDAYRVVIFMLFFIIHCLLLMNTLM